jgi:hypothetical protein
MAYNTKPILVDVDGNPISQYYNPDEDRYEPVEGKAGANKVILYNSDGSINNSLSLIPILDKLSQLTGTVIDEETRKSNELQRIALYNQISQMLADGELKGDIGDTGKGLEFHWDGTKLGVRVEGDTEYIYVDLRGPEGPQGPPGTIENLTKQHIVDTVGYLPVKSVNDNLPDESGNIALEITANHSDLAELDYASSGHTGFASESMLNTKLSKSGDTIQNYREKLLTLTGLTPNVDLSQSNAFKLTLEGATIPAFINPSPSGVHSFTLIIIQPATAHAITFPSSVKWGQNGIPDLTKPNKKYYLMFTTTDGGTTWDGMIGDVFDVS